ncbi:hypothetical protein O181_031385 [Austropuccinia psidii MF-1]|uniref:Uncharacterized protein n=1 Tax=Austropuccinia psidii MF-1 TaxID=1389203 RepID=A0A9Q3CXV6_9BASI|nr:hypothetical protein [Austropuccinia psidii MF-1]
MPVLSDPTTAALGRTWAGTRSRRSPQAQTPLGPSSTVLRSRSGGPKSPSRFVSEYTQPEGQSIPNQRQLYIEQCPKLQLYTTTSGLKRSVCDLAASQAKRPCHGQIGNAALHNQANEPSDHSRIPSTVSGAQGAGSWNGASYHSVEHRTLGEPFNAVISPAFNNIKNHEDHLESSTNTLRQLASQTLQDANLPMPIDQSCLFRLDLEPPQVSAMPNGLSTLPTGHSHYPDLHTQAIVDLLTSQVGDSTFANSRNLHPFRNPQSSTATNSYGMYASVTNLPFPYPSPSSLAEDMLQGQFAANMKQYNHRHQKVSPAQLTNHYPAVAGHKQSSNVGGRSFQDASSTQGGWKLHSDADAPKIFRDLTSAKVLTEKQLILGSDPASLIESLYKLPLPLWPGPTAQVESQSGFTTLRPFQFLKKKLDRNRPIAYEHVVALFAKFFDQACKYPPGRRARDFQVSRQIKGLPIKHLIDKSSKTGKPRFTYLKILYSPTVELSRVHAKSRLKCLVEKAVYLHELSVKKISGKRPSLLEEFEFVRWLLRKCFPSHRPSVPIIGVVENYTKTIQPSAFEVAQKLVIYSMSSPTCEAADTAALSLVSLWYKEERHVPWKKNFKDDESFWTNMVQQLCLEKGFANKLTYWTE